jgi:hypothetical protein
MTSSWQMETGNLVCHWSKVGRRVEYNPPWMQETSECKVVTCHPSRILLPTGPLGARPGSNAIPFIAILNKSSIKTEALMAIAGVG